MLFLRRKNDLGNFTHFSEISDNSRNKTLLHIHTAIGLYVTIKKKDSKEKEERTNLVRCYKNKFHL